jgi:hypothetical protein
MWNYGFKLYIVAAIDSTKTTLAAAIGGNLLAMAGLVEGLLVGPLGRRRPHGRPPLWGHEGDGKGDLGGIAGPLPIGRSQESGFSPCASPLPPSSSERERERDTEK